MSNNAFFEEQDQRSAIKTLLVERYFRAWARIVQPHSRGLNKQILYLDLFAGPGRYEDGSESTPIQLLAYAISDPKLQRHLVTIFNDKNMNFTGQLRSELRALPGIEKLTYQPEVWSDEVGSEVIAELRKTQLVPTLFFIDPWGYKGLTLDLIGQAIRGWGSDCIFFFNYNRINPAVTNSSVHAHMTDLFGAERLMRLQGRVKGLSPAEREDVIVRELSDALRDVGGQYVLPFQFKSGTGKRTSHYIIFVSKHIRGYSLMKDVMAGLSTDAGAVKLFRYVPPQGPSSPRSAQLTMFPVEGEDEPYSIAALKRHLLRVCLGATLPVSDVYDMHTLDTPYTLRNVKDSLRELEAEGRVTIDPPAARRRMYKGEVTLADDKLVTFPALEGKPACP